MKLEGLMSVSGKPGLYQMVGNRKSGLIVEPLGGGKREFAASRQHQFTPIESIAIFTDDGESVPIKDVLKRMLEQDADNAPPAPQATPEELREYMLDVLPNHDRERVYANDIKKLVRWYGSLKAAGILDAPDDEEEEEEGEPETAAQAPTEGSTEPSEAEATPAAAKPKEAKSGEAKPKKAKTGAGTAPKADGKKTQGKQAATRRQTPKK